MLNALYLFVLIQLGFPNFVYSQEIEESEFEAVKVAPPVTENMDSEWANGMEIGLPLYNGSGCPGGTASSILSPDRKTLTVLFDQYIVEAGSPSALRSNTKSCHLQIPFKVPLGFRVQVVRLDYRGFNFVPSGGQNRYSTTYAMNEKMAQKALGKKVKKNHIFKGPVNENYTLIGRVKGAHWSGCGEDFNLHVVTEVNAVSNQRLEQTIATVDSIDTAPIDKLNYHLRWKSCKKGNGRALPK
jgi:hypothetical protein